MNSLQEKIVVSVNEKTQSFSKEATLQTMLSQLTIAENGIAIAINEQIIPKTNWVTTKLNNKDKILIITATQGG
ncbi:MAG TPA: sulfur carrier protein ThiS [Crocinitomicaceae bacterium]|nr:sulfur carrier protein ThiS [Crocinitomicaceae bacterium]